MDALHGRWCTCCARRSFNPIYNTEYPFQAPAAVGLGIQPIRQRNGWKHKVLPGKQLKRTLQITMTYHKNSLSKPWEFALTRRGKLYTKLNRRNEQALMAIFWHYMYTMSKLRICFVFMHIDCIQCHHNILYVCCVSKYKRHFEQADFFLINICSDHPRWVVCKAVDWHLS